MTKRFKIFQKIAQTAATATDPATDTTTDTTTSTAPTTVAGSPTTVTTDLFPTFIQAWGTTFKGPVDELLNILNWSIYVLTLGEQDFYKLKSNDFSADATKYDAFTDSVISFSRLVFHQLLNGGKAFQTQVGDKKTPIAEIYRSISGNGRIPDTLTNVFPQSFLQTKIGNFKPKVISILSQMNALTG